ncbi:alpha/beta fold hydrolase [Dongia sedimenti]|uniref:Alpha/beta hydrolase n=1 Tax=Dongia sedimenti TaxID=3064282 RepID=A0ABU0YRS4_9PROT|nr:alpha/beta hydrolase [Rhodospirillaceae bacterium R-7]
MQVTDSEAGLVAFETRVEHRYARNGDIRLHYASIGAGPLIVFLHGFPDHWLTWWQQMDALSTTHRCVAPDLRGYNLSDQPEDLNAYMPAALVADVVSVIEDCGEEDAIVVGHDWGGFVAWHAAMDAADRISRLGIVNMPHPWAIARELALNPEQQRASAYVRMFQHPDAQRRLDFGRLSAWIRDAGFRERHDEAMARSNPKAMLNYYRTCFPALPYAVRTDVPRPIKVPTLVIHGLEDPYALPAGLNDLWGWVDAELIIRAWPGIGHFIQQDAPDLLTLALLQWLAR